METEARCKLCGVRYHELTFTVPSQTSEQWSLLLIESGAAGVEERDEMTLAKPPAGQSSLVVWIAPDDTAAFFARVREAAAQLPEPVVSQSERDEGEWRDAWKRYFSARPVPPFVIVPTWERYDAKPNEVVLNLDPGRAFGTGGHASTRLCLTLIGRLDNKPERFLDFGCGSGVLAVACARLFPTATGRGVDIDADAVEVSRENSALNQVEKTLQFSEYVAGTPLVLLGECFDLITANIQPEVLIPVADELARLLKPGGQLILSGILVEAAPAVNAAYQRTGLHFCESVDEEGWRALRFAHGAR